MFIADSYITAIKLVHDELGTNVLRSRQVVRDWCHENDVPLLDGPTAYVDGWSFTPTFYDWDSVTIGKARAFTGYVYDLRDAFLGKLAEAIATEDEPSDIINDYLGKYDWNANPYWNVPED